MIVAATDTVTGNELGAPRQCCRYLRSAHSDAFVTVVAAVCLISGNAAAERPRAGCDVVLVATETVHHSGLDQLTALAGLLGQKTTGSECWQQ